QDRTHVRDSRAGAAAAWSSRRGPAVDRRGTRGERRIQGSLGAEGDDLVVGATLRRGAGGDAALPGARSERQERAGDPPAARAAAMTLVLGIESSCDETACAVVADGRHVRSDVVASQHDVHARYGGVVPELASR